MQMYDRVAAAIHWLTALMVIALIVLAFGGDFLEKRFGEEFRAIGLHKSLGMTVFVLTLFRLVWRLGHKPPPLPATTPAWQRGAAHTAHITIYAFLLGMPILGYVFGSGGPYPMQWFGVDIPKMAIGKPVAEAAHLAHEIGGYAITALLLVHIAAAMWHQFVQRDGLIARMRLGSGPA